MENIMKAYLTRVLTIVMFIRYCEGLWIYSHVFYPKVIVILSDSVSTEGHYFHFDENELPKGNYRIKEHKKVNFFHSLLDFKHGKLNEIELKQIAILKYRLLKRVISKLIKRQRHLSKFPEIELVISAGAIYKTRKNTSRVRKKISVFVFRLGTRFAAYFRHREVTFTSASKIAYYNHLTFYLIHKMDNVCVADISNEMTTMYVSVTNVTKYFGHDNSGYFPILLRIFKAYDSCKNIYECNAREYLSPCVIPIVNATILLGSRKLAIRGFNVPFSPHSRSNACFDDVKEAFIFSRVRKYTISADFRQKIMQNVAKSKLRIIGLNFLNFIFRFIDSIIKIPKRRSICKNGLELSLRELFEIGEIVCQNPKLGFRLPLGCINITIASYILHYVWSIPLQAIITTCPLYDNFFTTALGMALENLYALFKANKSSLTT